VRVLEGRYLDRADREKGRFRSFILTSLKFFLADEMTKAGAGRGAARPCCRSRYPRAKTGIAASPLTKRRRNVFSSGAGALVLDSVVARLRDEYVQHGRLDHFNKLKVFLLGQGEAPYATLAANWKRRRAL